MLDLVMTVASSFGGPFENEVTARLGLLGSESSGGYAPCVHVMLKPACQCCEGLCTPRHRNEIGFIWYLCQSAETDGPDLLPRCGRAYCVHNSWPAPRTRVEKSEPRTESCL